VSRRGGILRASAVALVAATVLVSCSKRDDPEKFGREIVLSKTFSLEDVARFNEFEPDKLKPGGNALDVLASESVGWLSASTVAVNRDGSPYAVVIRVVGRVTGDEGAVTLWLAGFELQEKPGRPPSIIRPIAGLNAPKGGVKGDGRYERAGTSGPVTFLEAEVVRPAVALQRRAGLKIESVDVEVWSGPRSTTWIEQLGAWRWALVGVVMLVLWWFFFRKRD
jgi:hypothetical protein